MRDAGHVTATAEGDRRERRDRGDAGQPRGNARRWLAAAATVLIAGGGFESLLWADAHSDVSRTSPMLTAFREPAASEDDVVIVARPTEYGFLARVGGVLRLDGRCLFVDDPAGRRSAIVWPAGTRWSSAEQTVVHARSAQIRLGDTFYTGGGIIAVHHLKPTRSPDSSLDRAVDCGRRAGGNVVLLGPFPVEKE